MTTNEVSFFKQHRKVERKNHTEIQKVSPLKNKSIALSNFEKFSSVANRRYLELLSTMVSI